MFCATWMYAVTLCGYPLGMFAVVYPRMRMTKAQVEEVEQLINVNHTYMWVNVLCS